MAESTRGVSNFARLGRSWVDFEEEVERRFFQPTNRLVGFQELLASKAWVKEWGQQWGYSRFLLVYYHLGAHTNVEHALFPAQTAVPLDRVDDLESLCFERNPEGHDCVTPQGGCGSSLCKPESGELFKPVEGRKVLLRWAEWAEVRSLPNRTRLELLMHGAFHSSVAVATTIQELRLYEVLQSHFDEEHGVFSGVDTDFDFETFRLSVLHSRNQVGHQYFGGFVLTPHANEPRWAAILVFHEEKGTALSAFEKRRVLRTLTLLTLPSLEMEIQRDLTQSIRSAVIAQGEAEASAFYAERYRQLMTPLEDLRRSISSAATAAAKLVVSAKGEMAAVLSAGSMIGSMFRPGWFCFDVDPGTGALTQEVRACDASHEGAREGAHARAAVTPTLWNNYLEVMQAFSKGFPNAASFYGIFRTGTDASCKDQFLLAKLMVLRPLGNPELLFVLQVLAACWLASRSTHAAFSLRWEGQDLARPSKGDVGNDLVDSLSALPGFWKVDETDDGPCVRCADASQTLDALVSLLRVLEPGRGHVTARRVTVSFEMNPIVLKCEIECDGVFPNVNSLRLLSEPDPKKFHDLREALYWLASGGKLGGEMTASESAPTGSGLAIVQNNANSTTLVVQWSGVGV